ncbi:uncharacterized protein N7498_007870 [Penicillium cinerascens]|uniref:MADS-box domain-containing protein n=1 Tax=Penicillium cinerascens TaxID=70096 RepID=A0A9W9JKU9_9EURO|nr:uncharacterized protein N7498_007870 [Penicillium cinerascens]KAJ5198753.1 hypothetical protein N7498_007870 [Penicillium cinerascens]
MPRPRPENAPIRVNDRAQQEQIRKRRHNLFKRLKEFNDRYGIDIWMTMQMPSGWVYTFATKDEGARPGEADLEARSLPVIRKTPVDYCVDAERRMFVRSPPVFSLQRPSYCADGHGSSKVSESPEPPPLCQISKTDTASCGSVKEEHAPVDEGLPSRGHSQFL